MNEGSVGNVRHNRVHKVLTFDGSGGTSFQLFRVHGIILLEFIYGVVKTTLNADVDNISLDVFPTGGALVALATLVDSASAIKGSLFVKGTGITNALVLKSGAVPFVQENSDWKEPFITTIIGEQGDLTATFIRCTYSGVAPMGLLIGTLIGNPCQMMGILKLHKGGLTWL